MAIIGINYATKEYEKAAQIQRETYPIEVITIFGNKISKNQEGNGYFKWKPIIMNNFLKNLKEDDVLLYFDSTDSHSKEFFDFVNNHFQKNDKLFVQDNQHINRDWNKGDCFHYMNCPELLERDDFQVQSGLIGLKKTQENMSLLIEWNDYMKIDMLFSKERSMMLKDWFGDKGNKYDQSVLTNLLLKKGIDYSINVDNLVSWNAISI